MKHLFALIICIGFWSRMQAQNLPSYLPANGLVGWWPFNGNAQDESGNGNHGTVNGSALTTDRFGNAGKAYAFNGSSDFIQVEDANSLDFVNQFSIAAWVKISDYNGNEGAQAPRTIVGKARPQGGTGYLLGSLGLSIALNNNDQNKSIFSPTPLDLNEWNFVVGSYDGQACKLYKNSALQNSDNFVLQLLNSSNPLYFGKEFNWNNPADNRWFKGQIDDIAIYNRALTQQEITQLYQAGNETSLYYQLSQEKLGNCATSPVKLSVQTSVKVKTDSAGSIGSSSATVYGIILNDGGKTITRRGFCWGTSANPSLSNSFSDNGSGNGTFSGSLSALSPSTNYYLRAYAGTETEVWYGNEISFTTGSGSSTAATCGAPNIHNPNLSYGSMSDQDGNSYKTIVIGTQEWMAENLKTGHYRTGDKIPVVTDGAAWGALSSGASCWYNNDSASYDCPYGRLYNWYTTVDPRGLCPAGWHAPSDEEIHVLENFLDLSVNDPNVIGYRGTDVGGKLKSINYWISPNSGATNSSGFSNIPCGTRMDAGTYVDKGDVGYFWSSTNNSSETAFLRYLFRADERSLRLAYNQTYGFGVRCLKDTPETGSINILDCGADFNIGQIHLGQPASEVLTKLFYTGGNGGTYSGKVIASTGVSGLTASYPSGRFANGDSVLAINITGMPSATGLANFQLSLGGQSFTISRIVIAAGTGATDVDGNQYSSVIIGNQEWLAENLKVTHYRNGDSIRSSQIDTIWYCMGREGTLVCNPPFNPFGANAVYNNDQSLANIFGRLYNWYSVADPRNLCPAGWHIPTETDWNKMGDFLGCRDPNGWWSSGRKMKTTGTILDGSGLWNDSFGGSTNESGFNAIPSGVRDLDGIYSVLSDMCVVWSCSEVNESQASFFQVWTVDPTLRGYSYSKNAGFSVRCIRGEASDSAHFEQLECGSLDSTGLLLEQTAVGGLAYFTVPYSGGNGAAHPGQRITSTGVTGLKATLFAGQLANGSGLLKYYLDGTPDASGIASFALNIGGKTCTINWQVEDRINSLNCNAAVSTGTIYAGQPASGASTTISYTGGNGGSYSSQVISSIGVNGLTAILSAGNFASGDGSFVVSIVGTPEAPGIASFALNIGGQSCSFTRLVVATGGGVTDIDGNTYGSVIIGNQEWMSENLKVSRYRNGDEIPSGFSNAEWQNTTTGAFAYFNEDAANNNFFGKLYNWYAVSDSRQLCPSGWHIPSDQEWQTMELLLGMPINQLSQIGFRGEMENVGGKLKVPNPNWSGSNDKPTNEVGFFALPTGGKDAGGLPVPYNTFWWSSDSNTANTAWYRVLIQNNSSCARDHTDKASGDSVRCLKD